MQSKMQQEVAVVIVGAGPSGLATSACLNVLSVPHIILEKEDCSASLWKKRTYDRLKLHLAKKFCQLPHMPYPPNTPTFVPKLEFVRYLDDYAAHFGIEPFYNRSVECTTYDEIHRRWKIEVNNSVTGEVEAYKAEFLVIATGENSKGLIPEIPGLDAFAGEILHSSQYKSGLDFNGKEVVVVGCGNSGMEIAYDLSNFGVSTSIVVRSPFHVVTKELVYMGMVLLKFLPVSFVDRLTVMLATLIYGDLTKYGIHRPVKGPFHLKGTTGRSPVVDVGTVNKIKKGEIKVLPEIKAISKDYVIFDDGDKKQCDVLIFATGYESRAAEWLKDYDYILNSDGMPKNKFPNHWKGENGSYCAGFSQRGLDGVSKDAQAIANDIKQKFSPNKKLVGVQAIANDMNQKFSPNKKLAGLQVIANDIKQKFSPNKKLAGLQVIANDINQIISPSKKLA